MNGMNLQAVTTERLVQQFAELALQQDAALSANDIATVNRLFDQLERVERELKGRTGDQRRALLPLYDHPNAQVRLKAVVATLAVAPQAARRMLEIIANSNEFPQAGDAGMTVWAIENGIFDPT
jgi:hypothetical protein